MRFKLLIATMLSMGVMVIASGTAHANEQKTIDIFDKQTSVIGLGLLNKPEEPKVEAKKPVEYIVRPGDTLETISKAHTTTWKRLWDKNSTLTHPDQIIAGQSLTIPQSDEVLADRPLPVPPVVSPPPVTQGNAIVQRGAVAGNTYTPGYCTWYVKNMRPDLPNNLGNADTWYQRAAEQGFSVGQTPVVGAVAATKSYMHVALVIAVNGASVTVSEMNYNGLYVISTRTTTASEFNYIY